MNINYKQSQFELFPQAASGTDRSVRPSFFFSSITLSLENLIISGILILLFVVFTFALGVERGKRIVMVPAPVVIAAESRAHVAPSPVPTTQKVSAPSAVTPVSTTRPVLSEVARKSEQTIKAVEPLKALESSPLNYTIQVASYAKMELAQKEAIALKKKGVEAFVLEKGKYLIVCAGRFSGKDDAKVVFNRLQKSYKDCLLRRL